MKSLSVPSVVISHGYVPDIRRNLWSSDTNTGWFVRYIHVRHGLVLRFFRTWDDARRYLTWMYIRGDVVLRGERWLKPPYRDVVLRGEQWLKEVSS